MADVKVDIKTSYDGKGVKAFSKATDKLKKNLPKLGKISKGVGIAAAAGFGIASAAALKFGSDSVSLAQEQIRVEKQLEAVLTSTGNAAGLTADEIKDMASALQLTTNFGDEATLVGQNLLLTFTNIGAETFPRATAAMLDMSVAMGQDLKSSAQQIGKALNDPIKGVTALSRVGVQFTEQQIEQIKVLTESGDVVAAQSIILAELETQFKGSAAAAREADGGFIAAKNAFGDLQEEVGRGIIKELGPIMEDLSVTIAEIAPQVGEIAGAFFSELGPAVGEFGSAFNDLAVTFGFAEEGASGFDVILGILSGTFDAVLFVIRSVTGAMEILVSLFDQFDTIKESLGDASFKQLIGGVGGAFAGLGLPDQINVAKAVGGFAEGGSFTVGGSGGSDSELVQFMASPGERVTITNNINGIGGNELGELISGAIRGALQEYTNQILIPSFE